MKNEALLKFEHFITRLFEIKIIVDLLNLNTKT